MRLVAVLVALPIALFSTVTLAGRVFQPAPAADRLAGVSVAVTGYTITNLGPHTHQLNLAIRVSSLSDIDECLGFTFDEPFGNRRFTDPPTGCVKPVAGAIAAQIAFSGLTDDDLAFP